MYFYNLAIVGKNLAPLSYQSKQKIAAFTLVKVRLNGRINYAYVLGECPRPNFKCLEIIEIFHSSLSENQVILNQFLSDYYCSNLSLSLAQFIPKMHFTKANECKIFLQNMTQNCLKTSEQALFSILSETQKECLQSAKNHQFNLLFGDTGSGKTHIFINLIANTLNAGKQVLFLMPEISLTPQMCERLQKDFRLNLWHSKCTKKQKQKTLQELCEKKTNFILGARSALFLPFSNLGLIIVDEEHDLSYKSSKNPCYNARDLALFLASKCGAKIVLASATPSLGSVNNPLLNKIRLKGQFFSSKKELIFDDSSEILSEKLLNELLFTKSKNEISMIFLPVRGNWRKVVCKDCGSIKKCRFCSVAMSLHSNIFRCHYCGHSERLAPTCTECGGSMLESKNIGTAELESRLQALLPEFKIARLDSDIARSKKALKTLLESLKKGEIDVLIGTQLISKGHDYANVTFMAILGLDEYLNYPDFKAREQTLALAIQVAGRAGRSKNARILFNSKNAEFFEYYLNNFDEFLEDEKIFRANFPPFKRFLRILIEDKDQAAAALLCEQIHSHLLASRQNELDYEIVSYGACAIEKINKFYRFYVLLRSEKKMLLSKVARFYQSLQKVTIDIDPLEFL